MPAEIVYIRQFQPADAEACSRIVHICLNHDPLVPEASRQHVLGSETREIMLERARSFYVAVCISCDVVAGFGGVDMNEIRFLFVSPEHRRRGIGSSLLQHLETWIPPALFEDIFAYSSPGAMDFYRSHGYEPKGEHFFPAGDSSIPTIFMTKRTA
jgi:GNAT superfamily N-acetyltransferase